MTRDDIKKHFPDASDEQINALLDINSRDIGKHKAAAAAAAEDLEKANAAIADLEKNKQDSQALQRTIDEYKAAEEKRKAEAQKAQEQAERMTRFEKAHSEASKDRKWLNEFTRNGIFSQFEEALANDANKGKSDVEIYNSIINDEKGVKPGLFEAQVKPGMSGMGGNPSGDAAWLQNKFKGNPFFEG